MQQHHACLDYSPKKEGEKLCLSSYTKASWPAGGKNTQMSLWDNQKNDNQEITISSGKETKKRLTGKKIQSLATS